MSRVPVVTVLIILNILVFILWQWEFMRGRFIEGFMADNFLVSYELVLEGRYWTLLTSVFSHNLFLHILINMYVLKSFGGILERVMGSGAFLRFYLVAGIVSSISHCLVSQYIVGEPGQAALGASGAIAGLVLLFSLIFPKEKLLFFGIIPIPALFGALAFIALDLWGLSAQAKGSGLPIGHGAHLGGAFTGIVYYFLIRRSHLKPKRINQWVT